jgi:NAD(P)-dependent dehydrogenase (short-subunit alcohol dehydrogenase family)
VTRTAVVTGAGGGLGAATVRRLASRGWQVVATDLDTPALHELADVHVVTHVADVTDYDSVDALAAAVAAQCERLDALVTFAGIVAVGPLVEMPPERFAQVIDVNLVGSFYAVRALFPLLHAAQGRIVLISSETGWQQPMPFNAPYSTSKHGVEAFGDALRRELMLLDMPVVKIQPGAFRTGMVAGLMDSFERIADSSEHYARVLRAARKRIPQEQRRAGDPAQLAELVERALTTRRPRPAYRINTNPQAAALSALPTRVVDRLLQVAFRRI